ncbi:phd finger protein br140 lin, partial [Cystoisospora suis]
EPLPYISSQASEAPPPSQSAAVAPVDQPATTPGDAPNGTRRVCSEEQSSVAHGVLSGQELAVKIEDNRPINRTSGETGCKSRGAARQRKNKDSLRTPSETDPLAHGSLVRSVSIYSEDEKLLQVAKEEVADECAPWKDKKMSVEGQMEQEEEDEEDRMDRALLAPDRYQPDVCAVCLRGPGFRAGCPPTTSVPGRRDPVPKKEEKDTITVKRDTQARSAESMHLPGNKDAAASGQSQLRTQPGLLFQCRGCGVCVHRECYGGRNIRYLGASGGQSDSQDFVKYTSSPSPDPSTTLPGLAIVAAGNAGVQASTLSSVKKEKDVSEDPTAFATRTQDAARQSPTATSTSPPSKLAGTFRCDVCAWGYQPEKVSCLLCPRRGGALKAVQPLDSAAAWRRLHATSTSRSPTFGKTCRWKRPLYVHMLCALHAPAPPVKIANNRQLSPVWGVDLLATALQATRGPSRCLGGHYQGSFGKNLANAEDAGGLHCAIVHEKESPSLGGQSKSSCVATQWQGKSCPSERKFDEDEATTRTCGCCFCGHSSGFLVTCSYVRPVSRWRLRKGVYGYASTGPRLGLTSVEGDELDEWQDAYRVLGPHRTKAWCTGAARYAIGAEDEEARRCCRRRFHPICGQQQSVHVLFRTKNGDSQSFFFCLQHSEQVRGVPAAVTRLLGVYETLLQHRALLHDLYQVEEQKGRLLDLEEQLQQQQDLQAELTQLARQQVQAEQRLRQRRQHQKKRQLAKVESPKASAEVTTKEGLVPAAAPACTTAVPDIANHCNTGDAQSQSTPAGGCVSSAGPLKSNRGGGKTSGISKGGVGERTVNVQTVSGSSNAPIHGQSPCTARG